jgi:hypothetical protein
LQINATFICEYGFGKKKKKKKKERKKERKEEMGNIVPSLGFE